jgi:Zn-dependent M32 family carboxypeptidase
MTTRFKEGDLTEGLTGAIHETGHALYEQGRNLDGAWEGLPVNSALSMGIHESQSLFWERMVSLLLAVHAVHALRLRVACDCRCAASVGVDESQPLF